MHQERYLATLGTICALGTTALVFLVAGCASGSPQAESTVSSVSAAATPAPVGPGAIGGKVHGGQQAVTGATIQLYEVGLTGYTSGLAKPLIASTYQTGSVNSVTVTAAGTGYTSTPAVSFSGGGGSGAVGTAVLTSGAVTSVTITSAGSGYTSAPVVLFSGGGGSGATGTALTVGSGNALTDANGNFSISGDYTCDSGSYVFITAAGGNPGLSAVNPNIALTAALGPCSVLKANAATTNVIINEVTTVAAAYAMAQFTGNTTFGTALASQPGVAGSQAPADNFTTSSTNAQGIANAIAIAQVLANTTAGSSPGNNANLTATPEYWQINMLADILSACVNSAGGTSGDGSSCGAVFANVNTNGGAAPADTLQAAIYMARNPNVTSTQIANLYALIPAGGTPFNPYPSAAANVYDLTVGVSYNPIIPGSTNGTITNDLLWQTSTVALDKYGNAWIGNTVNTTGANNPNNTSTYGWLVELDPTGNPIQAGPAAGSMAANYEITGYSDSTTFEGFNDGSGFPALGMALDTSNNLWVADYSNSKVMKVAGSEAVYTSTGTATVNNGGNAGATDYSLPASTLPTAVAVDSNNDVFISTNGGTSSNTCSSGGTSSTLSTSADKGLVTFVAGSATNVNYGRFAGDPYFLAIDSGALDTTGGTAIPGSPFVWGIGYNQGGSGENTTATTYAGLLGMSYTSTGGTYGQGCYTAIGYTNSGTDYGITGSFDTTAAAQIPTANGTDDPSETSAVYPMASPYGFALDGSGNIWVSNTSYPEVNNASDYEYALTKIVPAYGSSFTAANAQANFTYTDFHDIAGMSSKNSGPRFLAVDGASDVWFTLNNGIVGAITSSGTALSPSYAQSTKAFQGSVAPTGTDFVGTTTAYSRSNGPHQIAIDGSGNIWIPQQGTTAYPRLTVIVGSAVPVATPFSTALANGTFGQKP